MKISIKHLSYGHIQDRVTWLEQNVGERKYVLHNQTGGYGWWYFNNDRVIEIENEQWATMFILKFGG
jgi:hypothetical protein